MCNRGGCRKPPKTAEKTGEAAAQIRAQEGRRNNARNVNTVGAAFTAYIFRLMPERMQNK